MKNKISIFACFVVLASGQSFANSNLEIDALDGTYEYKGVRVTEVEDAYQVSVDAFKDAPGVYHVRFPKKHCSVYRSGERFESINCSVDSYSSNPVPVFLMPRGPGSLEHLNSAVMVSFSLDRTFVTLVISHENASQDKEIRFSIQAIVTHKMLERTHLAFPI
ncbi:MAG: hypothetical protein WCK49_03105 [Myxococcaceae bacterium]